MLVYFQNVTNNLMAFVNSLFNLQSEPRPSLSNENLLINELIRDYLVFNKYKYTESVLLAGMVRLQQTVVILDNVTFVVVSVVSLHSTTLQ